MRNKKTLEQIYNIPLLHLASGSKKGKRLLKKGHSGFELFQAAHPRDQKIALALAQVSLWYESRQILLVDPSRGAQPPSMLPRKSDVCDFVYLGTSEIEGVYVLPSETQDGLLAASLTFALRRNRLEIHQLYSPNLDCLRPALRIAASQALRAVTLAQSPGPLHRIKAANGVTLLSLDEPESLPFIIGVPVGKKLGHRAGSPNGPLKHRKKCRPHFRDGHTRVVRVGPRDNWHYEERRIPSCYVNASGPTEILTVLRRVHVEGPVQPREQKPSKVRRPHKRMSATRMAPPCGGPRTMDHTPEDDSEPSS